MSKDQTKNVPELKDADFKKEWPQEKNFKYLKKMKDPRFGDITLLKNSQTGEVIFCKEKVASSKKEATNDILQLQSRMKLNNDNMLNMIDYSTDIEKQLCSTTYVSKAFYKFPEFDLKREQVEHKKNLTEFTASELSNCKNQVLSALNSLHSKNLVHGDIRPELIGHNKQNNSYALLDRFRDPSPLEKTQADNIVNKRDLFMSPALYKKLQGKLKTQTYNNQANDHHSLGMTLLSLGNNDSV